jgi:hypothetical protein
MPNPTAGDAHVVAEPYPPAGEAIEMPGRAAVDPVRVGVVACQTASTRAAQVLNANWSSPGFVDT